MKFKIIKRSERLNPHEKYGNHQHLIKLETTWRKWFKKKNSHQYLLIETYALTGVIAEVYTEDGEEVSIYSGLYNWLKKNFHSSSAIERKKQRCSLIKRAINEMEGITTIHYDNIQTRLD